MIGIEETRDRLRSELLSLSSHTHETEHALKESEAARAVLEEQLAEAEHLGKVEQKQRKILEESVAAQADEETAKGSIDFALHRECLFLVV